MLQKTANRSFLFKDFHSDEWKGLLLMIEFLKIDNNHFIIISVF